MRTVHRRVEEQAALKGDHPALVSGGDRIYYRDLNARANALARRLMAGGFRRGDLAVIALPPSLQLAIAELAVLKAGGAYACPVSRLAYTVATPLSVLRHGVAYGFDIALPRSVAACPNLPVLVREEDPACVLADAAGALTITVRHGAIVDGGASPVTAWATDAAPYAHWSVLMTGATLHVAQPLPTSLPSYVLDPAA